MDSKTYRITKIKFRDISNKIMENIEDMDDIIEGVKNSAITDKDSLSSNQAMFFAQCLEECRDEIKNTINLTLTNLDMK